MGGRGTSSSKKAMYKKPVEKKEVEQKKPSRKEKAIAVLGEAISDFIKTQVNVDINKYRDEKTKRFDTRRYITVDWKRMPQTERQQLSHLTIASYSKTIDIEKQGTWMALIKFKYK